ncbi:LuxR C-terminal-related transcriptional regulator [Zafaria sp. Z1313]|uniref:LuxR C-terminal-related transcriptional regulator n=1 Tax=Zafaria sp. Z1313 TaxID=3423202 RepID=UPI003D3037C5
MTSPSWRQPIATELAGLLTSHEHHGVVLVGPPGAGKTTLVEEVLTWTGHSGSALRLHCSPHLAAMDYAVLAPFLDVPGEPEPVSVLRCLQSALAQGTSGGTRDTLGGTEDDAGAAPGGAAAARGPGWAAGRAVIVLEDHQHLDPASGFVLTQLVYNRSAFLLAVGHTPPEPRSPLHALVTGRVLSTLSVSALDVDGVAGLCASLLGGAVTATTARVVHAATAGNPALVGAFIDAAASQGILHRSGAGSGASAGEQGSARAWYLSRALPEADAPLIQDVLAIHRALPEGEREAIELLAHAGPAPVEAVRAATGRPVPEGHLLVVEDGIARVPAELYAACLRAAVPGAVWRSRWEEAGGAEEDWTHRRAAWALDAGQEVPVDALLAGAREALTLNQHDDALAMCHAVDGGEPGRTTSLLRARTYLATGRISDALGALRGLESIRPPARTARQAVPLWLRAVHRATGRLDADELLRETMAGFATAVWGAEAAGGWERDAYSMASARWWRAVRERGLAAEEIDQLRGLLDPAAGRKAGLTLRIAFADALSGAGRTTEAAEFVRGLLEAGGARVRRRDAELVSRLAWNLALGGEYAQARDVLEAWHGTTPWEIHHRGGSIAALGGLIALLSGDADAARGHLSEAVPELEQRDPAGLLTMARELAAAVGAVRSRGGSALPRVDEAPTAGQLAVARGLADPAGWERAALDARAARLPLAEANILLAAVAHDEVPAASVDDVLDRLAALASAGQGPRPAAMLRFVRAARSGRGEEMTAVADAHQHDGEAHLAALGYAQAVLAYDAERQERRRGAALRSLLELQSRAGRPHSRLVERAAGFGALSDREQGIAALVARGMSNVAIARELVLSPRTVEGHVYRIFAKLGISERSELARWRP